MALIIVAPHTHWDREWYEPEDRFRQRLVAAIDRLLDILDRDPEFRCFLLDGQAALADDYLDVRPEQHARLTSLARAGRILLGPWYILADELLSSDESLVRNLLLGRRRATDLGNWTALGYSPDAFGHPATLPTLWAGFGIKNAILWRGYGGEPGQETDLFRWIGPDGSEVLTHHLAPQGYEIGASLPPDPKDLEARWREVESVLEKRAAAPVWLLPAGADHHAPDPDLPARIAALRQIAGGHQFRIGSPGEYFAALPPRLKVPRIAGELRFSYRYAWTIQGGLSARAGLKRAVREADRLLVRWAEPQISLSTQKGQDTTHASLRAAWQEHLLNHFHDSLCGSVSDEVATEVVQRAQSVSRQARGLLVDALHDRLGQDRARARRERKQWTPSLVMVNPSPRAVRHVVEATVTVFQQDVVVGRVDKRRPAPRVSLPQLVDPDGRVAPVQVLEEYDAYERLDSPDHYPDQDRVRAFRVAIDAGDLPAFGIKSFRAGAGGGGRGKAGKGSPLPPVDASDRRFDYAWRLRIGSERDEGDTYTFEPVAADHAEPSRWSPSRKVWDGPLIAAVSREFTVGDRARGTAIARVDAGSTLLRIAIDGVNLRGNHRLRVRIPPSRPVAPGAEVSAVADMQFGPVVRGVERYDRKDFPREWPVTTAPAHRYVSVAASGLTVFLRGATEYELNPDGSVTVTLFRAVGDLSRGELRARPGHAAWLLATPGAQEPGPFRVELGLSTTSVGGASGPDDWDDVEQQAEEFHAAPAGLMLRYGIDLPSAIAGPSLSGAGLAFVALKPREAGSGVVARCVNLTREKVAGTWTWPRFVKQAWLARLDETVLGELAVSSDRRQVRFTAEPRAVVTVVVDA